MTDLKLLFSLKFKPNKMPSTTLLPLKLATLILVITQYQAFSLTIEDLEESPLATDHHSVNSMIHPMDLNLNHSSPRINLVNGSDSSSTKIKDSNDFSLSTRSLDKAPIIPDESITRTNETAIWSPSTNYGAEIPLPSQFSEATDESRMHGWLTIQPPQPIPAVKRTWN